MSNICLLHHVITELFQMKYYFSVNYFLLNAPPTLTNCILKFVEHWLTDSTSIHKWYSFQNASVYYNSEVSYFNFYVICIFKRKWVLSDFLANSLLRISSVIIGCLIHIDIKDVPHFLILPNTFLCNFLAFS